MVRVWLAFVVFCGVACGGQVDDRTATPGTTLWQSAGSSSATNGGAQQVAGTSIIDHISENTGGQSASSQHFAGASQGGAVDAVRVRLMPISYDEAGQIFDNACNGYSIENEPYVLHLEWLVDASSSQAEPAQGAGPSKWDLSREFVLETNAQLAARGECVAGSVGLLAFPLRKTDHLTAEPAASIDSCIDTARRFEPTRTGDLSDLGLSPIKDWFGNIVPVGGTPLLDAYRDTIRRIIEQTKLDWNYVALVTDGMPSIDSDCRRPTPGSVAVTSTWPTLSGDDNLIASVDPIIEEIARAAAQGIRTIVVGSSSEPTSRAWLSQAATAGGTAWMRCGENRNAPYCHLELTDGRDQATAIAEALTPGSAPFSCRFPVFSIGIASDFSAADPERVVPIITGRGPSQKWIVPYDDGPAESCAEGFRLVSPEEFELCPAACSLLKNQCTLRFEVVQLCKTQL